MLREINDLKDISDGRLYSRDDMVKANCRDCEGCSKCCHGMGNTLILDPYDVFRLCTGLGRSFEGLLSKEVSLNVVDGLILPNIAMTGADESCNFLGPNGRCTIHNLRPGICRLFPLGRLYDETGLHYILQTGECALNNPSKIKVKQWIDTPNLKENEVFEVAWHNLLSNLRKIINKINNPELQDAERKKICMTLISVFYITPYEGEDFYSQYYKRQSLFLETLGITTDN